MDANGSVGDAGVVVGSLGRVPTVSRYSISFEQPHVTEITPLIPTVAIRKSKVGSLGSFREWAYASSGPRASPRSCRTPYASDDEDSECDFVARSYHEAELVDYSLNNEEEGVSRSFSEGTAILKYSSASDLDKPLRFCTHGNNYDECCGKGNGQLNGNANNGRISSSSHCHRNEPPQVDYKARRRLIIASILCVCFMAGEVAGGYLADSLAIMTDAAHLLTDFASFMISLFALWVATRPSSRRMNFGWYRAEVVGALTSVLLIWVVTGILVYLAIQRIINKDYEIQATIMLITSGVGVAVNIIMGITLSGHGHSHGGGRSHSHGGGGGESHGHSHAAKPAGDGHDAEAAQGHNHAHEAVNINVRAAFIHVIGDFLQSIGVFIAALIIYFKPTWGIVDPICTFLFSILVLITTFAIMKDTLTVLMEGLPKGVDFNDVHKTFFIIEGVVQVHNLRIWSLSMDKIALSAHVVVTPGTDPQDVLKKASQIVREKYSFFEMTLQIEDLKEDMSGCKECQTPS